WQTLWRVGTRGRLGTVIQMLLRVSPVDDANIRMELTLQQWIDPVATIRQSDHLLCLTKSPTLGLQAAHRVELTGVPHRRRVRREQSLRFFFLAISRQIRGDRAHLVLAPAAVGLGVLFSSLPPASVHF